MHSSRLPRLLSAWAGFVPVCAILLALALVAWLVVERSRAAFSATTGTPQSQLAAGTVHLTDDDAEQSLVNVSAMAPGEAVVQCIAVTYEGTLTPAEVRMYAAVSGSGLAQYVDTKVEVGASASFEDCSGFTPSAVLYTGTLANLAAHTAWNSGIVAFEPAASPVTRAFRFTFELADDNSAQGLNALFTVTWEAQSV